MVLIRAAVALWPAAMLLALTSACVPKVPPQRLPTRAQVAVAYVVDPAHGGELSDGPTQLKKKIAEVLDQRNLDVKEVPFAALNGQRLTAERLQSLQTAAGPDAPFAVLVEVRASFFAQINGRFRWTVSAKLSVTNQKGPAQSDAFEMPALMQFEHERVPEAVADVAETIANRLAPLIDGLLISANQGSQPQASRPAESIYFVMIDRFANGDVSNDQGADPKDPQGFHGGDLNGLRARLDWLQSLGVRTVWLSPVFRLRAEKVGPWGGYHGYWVENLAEVEPRFGSLSELQALSADLHARGMELVLDLVLNHAAPKGLLTKQHPDWFHHQGDITDWNDANQVVNGDVHGLPDFASEKPEVYRYLFSSSKHFIDQVHPDGFRLDAVKHMPNDFWSRFNRDVEAATPPGFWRLGELLDGDAAAVSSSWREGHFNAMFDFPLRFALVDVFCRNASPARLAAVMTDDRRYPDPSRLVTLVDNHDLPRITSECQGDQTKVEQALAFLFTARGVPSFSWGTEVGMAGEKEPANRASMVFDDAHPTKALVSRLLTARAVEPALARGAPMVLAATKDAIAVLRVTASQVALTTLDRGPAPLAVTLPPELDGVTLRPLGTMEKGRVVTSVSPLEPGRYAELAARAERRWRTGDERRAVEISARGAPAGTTVFAVGSGPELGGWKPAEGLKLPARAELPVGGVFELKLVAQSSNGQPTWEPGDNRVVFVEAGSEPMRLVLEWGKT